MNVGKMMTRSVKTCDLGTNLEMAAKMMWDNDCGALPIIDEGGHPLGMVTDRDIAMSSALNHKPLWDLTSGEVMGGRKLFTCKENDDVRTALSIMQAHKVRRLPVVDGDGRLQGILSIDDIVALSGQPKGKGAAELPLEDTMNTLKSVCIHH
jgi:CBS domain-containing protein